MEPGKIGKSDYDYIIRVIQYLEYKHGIALFITTRDFDVLYRWWEKRIPLEIIKESISIVARRRAEKKKKIASISSFYFEVKKNFKAFLELQVGDGDRQEKINRYEDIENFLKDFPEKLLELKSEFETIFLQLKAGNNYDLAPVYEKLLDLFVNDEELNLKVEIFINQLAPRLRNPEIKKKYRLNYLLNKFNIPDFDLFVDKVDQVAKGDDEKDEKE